jgi:hypothetical protein
MSGFSTQVLPAISPAGPYHPHWEKLLRQVRFAPCDGRCPLPPGRRREGVVAHYPDGSSFCHLCGRREELPVLDRLRRDLVPRRPPAPAAAAELGAAVGALETLEWAFFPPRSESEAGPEAERLGLKGLAGHYVFFDIDLLDRTLYVVGRRPGPAPAYRLPTGRRPLFGFARFHRAPAVALTEGPLDAAALWTAGIPALALLGLRPTRDQVRLLRRFDLVVLVADPDPGGELFEAHCLRELPRAVPLRLPPWAGPVKALDPSFLAFLAAEFGRTREAEGARAA